MKPKRSRRSQPANRSSFRPFLEVLEERLVLSTFAATFHEGETSPPDPIFAGGEIMGVPFEQLFEDAKGRFSKLDTNLVAIAHQMEDDPHFDPNAIYPDQQILQISEGKIVVDTAASGSVDRLRSDLNDLGFEEMASVGVIISGWLPLDQIDELAALQSLQLARSVISPSASAGSAPPATTRPGCSLAQPNLCKTFPTGQADLAMASFQARKTFGVDGTGITVGVISDSYDANVFASTDAAMDISTGDLPSAGSINILDDPLFGTDEGRAMMQLIHNIAPGASLAFHTALFTQATFAEGILELADTGVGGGNADVIVDDVIYFAEPFFQDGIIAQAVDKVVANGVSYFSSAGNYARRAYESEFRPSGVLEGPVQLHDFDPGSDTDILQQITVPAGTGFTFILQWDSPFFSVSPQSGGSQNDLDVFMFSSESSGIPLASSFTNNIGGDPVEIFQFTNFLDPLTGESIFGTEQYSIAITHNAGPEPTFLKHVLLTSADVTIDEFDTVSGTSFGHKNARGTVSVGAAEYLDTPAFGTDPPLIEDFSSAGPTPIFFDTDGNRLSTPEIRLKPQITAPDGTDTTFFGFDSDDDGFPNFFGTSAAAPHAAAVAALMLQANPNATPQEIYAALEATAIDMDDPATASLFDLGFDFGTGFGLIQADKAIEDLLEFATAANEIIYVDVSDSMGVFYGDINNDGILDDLDDLNGDGLLGTNLDALIQRILDDEVFLPPTVALGILGANAQLLDMSPAAGIQTTVDRTADLNGNGVTDFHEVLGSLRIGTGGPFTPMTVDPSRTFYEPALDSIRALAIQLVPSTIVQATNDTVTPIVITSLFHGLATGDRINISGVLGNTAANGDFTVTVIDSDNFSLDGSTGDGDYEDGGVWSKLNTITGASNTTKSTGTITEATNKAPIVISSTGHDLATGDRVTVSGVLGNTAANGDFVITVTDPDKFSLDGSTGNGDYLTGGTWTAPIVISSAGHGLATGDRIRIVDVLGNTAANGEFIVKVIDSDSFTLQDNDGKDITGDGNYVSGGEWNRIKVTTSATIYSDGAGRLPDQAVRDPLAGFPIEVDVEILGNYQLLSSTADLTRIATETMGSIRKQIGPPSPEFLSQYGLGGGSSSGLSSFGVSNTQQAGSGGTQSADDSSATNSGLTYTGSSGTLSTIPSTNRSRHYRTGGENLSPNAIDEFFSQS